MKLYRYIEYADDDRIIRSVRGETNPMIVKQISTMLVNHNVLKERKVCIIQVTKAIDESSIEVGKNPIIELFFKCVP